MLINNQRRHPVPTLRLGPIRHGRKVFYSWQKERKSITDLLKDPNVVNFI